MLLLVFTPSSSPAQTTGLFFDSQAGDYIGGGVTRVFVPPEATFTASRNFENGVSINVNGPAFSYWWTLEFSAAGDAALAAGTYLHATRYPFTPFVGMTVSGSGRGCNTLTGRFVVLEAVYGADGSVLRFAADLEQHCEDADAALFAAVRFNSTIATLEPFAGDYPKFELSIVNPVNGIVTGDNITCGGAQTACGTTYAAATVAMLTAVPDAGYIFAGWTGGCSGGPTTTINVNSVKACGAVFEPAVPSTPRTLLVWDSQLGDAIGLGKQRVYSPANSVWRLLPWQSGGLHLTISSVDGRSDSLWHIVIDAGDGPLSPGEYPHIFARAFKGSPGLEISGNGSGCSTVTGRLVIHEIEYAPDDTVLRFAADLEQHCGDTGPGSFIALRYNSLTTHHVQPFFGSYPAYSLAIAPPLNGAVHGSGLSCGNGLSACTTTFGMPTTVTLTATANSGYHFAGWTGACRSASPAVTLHVNSIKACGASFEPSVPVSAASAVVVDSMPGDFIGNGRRLVFTPANSDWWFDVSEGGRTVRLWIEGFEPDGESTRWTFEVRAPLGTALAPGAYAPATRAAFTRFAGLDVSGDHVGCNQLTGRFVVLEIGFAMDGTLNRFAADVEQHCEDRAPGLFAAIRYNSLLPGAAPFQGAYPKYGLSFDPPHNGVVTGDGVTCGGGHGSCAIEVDAPVTATFRATPDAGFVFTGWTGACSGGTEMTVNVNTVKHCGATFAPATPAAPQTVLLWDSAPGDFIGQGQQEVYSSGNSVWIVSLRDAGRTVAIEVISIGDTDQSHWRLEFASASSALLGPGSYSNATRYPFNSTTPGLSAAGNGRGCNTVAGSFTIHELIANSPNVVTAFAVDFEQHCGTLSNPPLRGTLRFNSAVPLDVSVPPPPPPSSGCATPDPFVALGGGTCYEGNWLPPGMPIPGASEPSPPPAPPSSGGCPTPDPFVALGGGTCYNGNWLPPGMPIPGAQEPPPATPPLPSPPPPPPSSGGCPTPDPFVALGGGTCYNGNWLPPGMPIPGAQDSPPATPPPPSPPPPPPSSGGCPTPDPFVALGGGTCYNGNWLPPGMPIPDAPALPESPPPAASSDGCVTPDPFIGIPGLVGICQDGGWIPAPGVRATGTVQFTSNGSFWTIAADDGTVYSPAQALPSSLQVEGLRVTFSGTFIESAAPGAPGRPINLVSIQPL